MFIKNLATSLLRRVEDFVIPPLCVVCDNNLVSDDRWFCSSCLDKLSTNHNSRNACPRCSQNRNKKECACEFAWDFPFDKAWSAYDYDDVLRSVARHIKYGGKRRLAYHIGGIIAPLIPKDFFDGAEVVIPVPLHKSRMRSRGYNQAEALARGMFDNDSCGHLRLRTDLLMRVRNTGTQTKLDREERLENLRGAFAVDPQKNTEIKNKSVILVDDILTTGATVEACTDVLLNAGCSSVRVLSMGRD